MISKRHNRCARSIRMT